MKETGLSQDPELLLEEENIFSSNLKDYTEILRYYNLEYTNADYYLQVGNITHVQGWILHLSVVIYQIHDLFKTVIPFLAKEKTPFKIAMNKETAQYLMHGHFGNPQLGKIICIYPESDTEALSIAKKLIQLTTNFKGPRILTDQYLGSILYTRYGSHNPVIKTDEIGRKDKYIYNKKGVLIKDPYSIPFKLEKGTQWPFSELSAHHSPISKKTFKQLYKATHILKEDARGNVYQGIYIKGLFKVSACVIKQGNKHMYSEDSGRDIYDRLLWQYQLQQELYDEIKIPKAYDFFVQNEDCYLIMEYISGISLFDRLKQLNPLLKPWYLLGYQEQLITFNYVFQILSLIEKLHIRGYVHRDIQPGNFLVTKDDQVFMIDIELAWSLKNKKPAPPFELGTPGFMAPEQELKQTPSIYADIYSIGALLETVFTGLSPTRFDTNPLNEDNINFFVRGYSMAKLINNCLNATPYERPSLQTIREELFRFQEESKINKPVIQTSTNPLNIKNTLEDAVAGIARPPIVMSEGVWYFKDKKRNNRDTPQQKEYTRYGNLYEGIGGTLYVIARAKRAGVNISDSLEAYKKGWHYILNTYLQDLDNRSGGLYTGSAGVALTLKEGIEADLAHDNEMLRSYIRECLSAEPKGLNIAQGAAGNNIALLQCKKYIPENIFKKLLRHNTTNILQQQQRDGSWLSDNTAGVKIKSVGFANGVAGIIWSLLETIKTDDNAQTRKGIYNGLHWLQKQTNNLEAIFDETFSSKIINTTYETGDERTGIIIAFIKAFEVLHQEEHRKIAEIALNKYFPFVITNNFSQNTGLAGLGEVYIEAAQVFKNPQWHDRASWIAELFQHTASYNNQSFCYWQTEDNNPPTAELMNGNAGIIHFLLRHQHPETIGYRLLK
ncbi:MAG: lanthionine synthetase LanC family protein [Chitinophagaceae bacterium]